MAPTAIETKNVFVPPDLDDKEKFSNLKKLCIKPEDVEKVTASWQRLLVQLDKKADEIKAEGSNYIPAVNWEDVKKNNGQFPDDVKQKFLQRGCVIVRNVIDQKTCEEYFNSMSDFVKKHPEIGGYPNPVTNWFAFWTEGEVKARSHPEMIKLMKCMSEFFHIEDETLPIDKTSQVVYPDAFRIRPPGASSTLDLHLDSGSIERWEDETYRKMYAPILEGRWEEWEPWRLDERAFSKCDLYSHLVSRPTATSAFRALQGWLALSSVKSGEGTIRLLPDLKLANAYSVLRPFFWRDDGEIDLETPKFPGAIVGSGQFFCTETTHPHLRQLDTVHSIPYVNTGDFVFWHADLPHEVDRQHNGNNISSVFFNGYVPLCPYNIDNMLATRQAFLEGRAPRDFSHEKYVHTKMEGDFEDHGARKENILTDEGLRGMGFKNYDENEAGLTPGQKLVRKMANEAMETGKPPSYSFT